MKSAFLRLTVTPFTHAGRVLGGLALTGAALLGFTPLAFADADMQTVLHFFSDSTGALPNSTMVLAPDGNMYGTTEFTSVVNGSLQGEGVLYRLASDGSVTTVYTFTGIVGDHLNEPSGDLILGSDGNLYGTANEGMHAAGALYRMSTAGALTVLYSFSGSADGKWPDCRLVQDSQGNLLGTTRAGGSHNAGTIFRLNTDGSLTTLYVFSGGTGGSTPHGKLVLAADGSLYGTTEKGGANNQGTVFKLSSTGAFTTLYNFAGADGASPMSGVVMGNDGNLYGTTYSGGAGGYGTIFELTPTGVETTLHSFTAAEGNGYASLAQGQDGNWYGASLGVGAGQSLGTVFSMTPSGVVTTLYAFHGADGEFPFGGITLDASGNLFGTAWEWGDHGVGTVFALSPSTNPVPPLVAISASTQSASVGQNVALSWTSSGATLCVADDDWSGSQPLTGTGNVDVSHSGTNTFTLVCAGVGATAAQSAVVTGFAQPTVSLSASPMSVAAGGTTTLTWSSTEATSCTATGAWSGSLGLSGSQAVTVATVGANTFTLTCTGSGGSASNSVTVTGLQVPVVTLSASSNSVPTGQSVTLTWTSSYATSCVASESWSGNKATSGSETVVVSGVGSFRYSLSCSNVNGSSLQTVTVVGQALPTINLWNSPTQVPLGQSTTLNWTTTNVTSCTAGGAWSGSQANSGSQSVVVSSAGINTYTLTCTGLGGTTSQSVTATGLPPPAIDLSANPTSVPVGQSTTLTWSATNATSCTAGGAWSGSEATSGSQSATVSSTGANTYTLTCTGAGGSASKSVSVTGQPLPTLSLSANPTSVVAGQSTTLTWSSANTSACTASGAWSGNAATSGSQAVTVSTIGANGYTLTCSGLGGSISQTVTVTGQTPPPTVSLSASAGSVLIGQSVTLTWSSTYTSSCTASGKWSGSVATSGSQSVTISQSGANSYTLSCTGAGGTSAQSVTVTGKLPTLAFQAGAETARAAANGKVTVTIPVTLSNAIAYAVSAPYTKGGTESASGYTVTPSGTLSIPAGGTSASFTVNVTSAQCNKTVVLTLGTPTNASLGATAVNTLTLKTALLCN